MKKPTDAASGPRIAPCPSPGFYKTPLSGQTRLPFWSRRTRTPGGRPARPASLRFFTHDAVYLHTPYEEPVAGLDAIRRMWDDDRDSPDEVFTLATSILAVDGGTAVARAEVR